MSPRFSLSLIALLAACAAAPLPRLEAREPNDKAARILEPLLKRPGSGPLFERFINAWLDSGTLEELGQYLAGRVATEPTTPNRLLLALFFSRQGEPVKALEQFRAALASEPGSAEIWYQKALLESRTLDFDSAIASLQKCLTARPAGELPLQAAQLLGKIQARAGRTAEALATWKALLESRPGDTDLREDIMELQIAESLWPAARETAEALVAATADPYQRILRRMRLGDVLDRSGQREQALATFTSCLEDSGAGSWLEKEILSQIEKLFRREDDLAGLRACFAGLLEKNAHRAGLQRAQARLLMDEGEVEAAVACGRALLALSPGDRGVREEFIALLTSANRSGEAIPQVEQLLAQNPADTELLLTLADLKHAAKDDAGALAALRSYEAKMSTREGSAARLAGLMDRYGMSAEAIQTLRSALAAGGAPELRLMLAAQLHKSGDKAAALLEWKNLAASGTPAAVLQSVRAMQAHGERDAAWELMQSALPKAEGDSIFLTQLCALADSAPKAAAALPAVRKLAELSRSAPDLNAALDAAVRLARLSGQEAAFIADVAASAATAQAFCLLATLREAARDSTGANAALEKARELAPDIALAQLVRLWSMRGDFVQAARVAESLFQSPGGRQGHVAEMLVSLHQRAGDAEAALKWCQEWRRLVPGAAAAVLTESKLLESLGRDTDALAALRGAAGRFENNPEIRARLAALSLETGRTEEALRYYSSLYEEAADLSGKMKALPAWGNAALKAGQLDRLIARFEERRRENRGSAVPLMALAELHRIADNYEARRNALTEAARLKPDDPEIALEIARLEWRERDGDAAIRTLRSMLAKDSGGRIAAELADILIATGQQEEGLKLLAGTATASPSAVENAAQALARRDDQRTALTFLNGVLAKFPDDGRLQFLAALLEWQTGDADAAVKRLLPLTEFSGAAGALRPGLVPNVSSLVSRDDAVVQAMPPEVRRFFRLLTVAQQLTPQSPYGWVSPRQTLFQQLPADRDELQSQAAALILTLARSAGADVRRGWLNALKERGYPFAAAFVELPSMRGLSLANAYDSLDAVLRAAPDSPALLALAAFNACYRQSRVKGLPALMEKTWNTLKGESLQAAVILTLPQAGRQKDRGAWEDEVLAAAEKLPDGVPLLVYSLVQNLERNRDDDSSAPGGDDADSARPDAGEGRRRALLARWLGAMNATGAVRPGFPENVRAAAFSCLASRYAEAGDAPALAALLDTEWSLGASQSQSPSSRSGETLAGPLGFPPWFLPGMQDPLRSFLSRTLSADVAGKTSPLIRDPLLRVFVAGRAGSSVSEKAVQDVLAKPGDSAVPYILGAAWAEKRGDYAAAGERAVKALYLPVTPEVRRSLDGALVWWASRNSRPDEPLYAAGREAALRLRRDATSDQKRSELATLLDKLGLAAEGDRLMRQGKAAAAVNAGDRLERLLDEGKFKEALPQLTSQLRSWARERLMYASRPQDGVLAEWRTKVQQNGLLPQVREALLPPRPTPQQLAEYGAACELLGDLPEAIKAYGQALELGVRRKLPQLLLGMVRADKPRALGLLKQFPELWEADAVRTWAVEWIAAEENASRMEDQTAFCRLMTEVLDAMPERYAAAFPASLILELAGRDCLIGEFGLTTAASGKLIVSPEAPAAERERGERLHAEWLDSLEALARRLLMLPGSSLQTMETLKWLGKLRGRSPGALFSDATGMLVRELKIPAGKRTDGADDSALLGWGRELMAMASREGRLAEFADSVVRTVRETRSPAAAANFLPGWPLYECPAEQFSAVARELFARLGREAWKEIIPAAAQRKLGADLAPLLEETWTHPGETENDDEFYFGDWLNALEAQQGRAAAEAFFHRVVNGLLDPATKKVIAENGGSAAIRTVQRLVGDVGQAEDPGAAVRWTGFALRWVRDVWVPLSPDASFLSDSLPATALNTAMASGDPAMLRGLVESLPIFEEAGGFYCSSRDMMERVVAVAGSAEPEKYGLMFGDGKGLSFGRKLVGVFQSPRLVCSALAGSEQEIEALPEARREGLKRFLRALQPGMPDKDEPAGRAFYDWLFKDIRDREAAELSEKVEKFITDARTGKYETEEQIVDGLKPMLADMANAGHPRSREAVMAAWKAMSGRGATGSGGGILKAVRDTADSSGGWTDWKTASGQLTGMMAALLGEGAGDETGVFEPPSAIGRSMARFTDEPGTTAEDFLQWLGPWLQPGEARLIVARILDDSPERYTGLEKIEVLRGRTPFEELRLEAEMALRLFSARAGTDNGTNKPEARPEVEHYAAILKDASLPLSARIGLGAFVLQNSGWYHPQLVFGQARLLIQARTARLEVAPRLEAEMLNALSRLPADLRDAELEKAFLTQTALPRRRDAARDWRLVPGLLALLDMAVRHHDDAAVDRLLEMQGAFPGIGALTVLARRGEAARLAALLKSRPAVLQNTGDAYYHPLTRYDSELAVHLPAAVSGIEDPVVRFEALSTLISRFDAEPLPEGLKPHPQRCEEMAVAAAAVPWRSPAVRDRAVDTTVWADEPPPASAYPFMEEAVRRVPLDAHVRCGGGGTITGFHAALILRALKAGDGAPLLAALRTLRAMPSPRPPAARQVLEQLLRNTNSWLLDEWPGISAGARAAICEAWRQAVLELEVPEWEPWCAGQLNFCIVLHGLAGMEEGFRQWSGTLLEIQQCGLRKALGSGSFDDVLELAAGRINRYAGTEAEKSARLRAVFLALNINPLVKAPSGSFQNLTGTTPEDFLLLEEPMMAAFPDNPDLALEFSEARVEAGALEPALRRVEAALKKLPPGREIAYARLLNQRVNVLEKLNRSAEAEPAVREYLALPNPRWSDEEDLEGMEKRLSRWLKSRQKAVP